MIRFSVVIPVYNEEEALGPLYSSLRNVMDGLREAYEIIFVNDGSTDKSPEVLKGIDLKPSNLVVVNLNRHRGKSEALQTGFDVAKGEVIITMDADLQNDPTDIPALLNRMKQGYDVVCGWRHKRYDPAIRLLSSKIANALRKIITKEKIHDLGCPFRAFKRECLNGVYLSGGLHRFFTLIMAKLGYKIGEIKIKHHPRRFGKTKYNIRNRIFESIIDMFRLCLFDINKLAKPESS